MSVLWEGDTLSRGREAEQVGAETSLLLTLCQEYGFLKVAGGPKKLTVLRGHSRNRTWVCAFGSLFLSHETWFFPSDSSGILINVPGKPGEEVGKKVRWVALVT